MTGYIWYLLVLLVFSFLMLSLFKNIQRQKVPGTIHFISLPLVLFFIGIIKTVDLGGWDLTFYLVIFIYGYYLFSAPSFTTFFQSTFKIQLILALITTVVYVVWFLKGFPEVKSMESLIFYAVRTLNCWSWLLCIFYLANKYLSFLNRFLHYSNEISMPFYILHQPVIILVGFLIRHADWPVYIKLLFLITVSFIVIMCFYHIFIRSFNIMRFLFGIKGRRRLEERADQSTITLG